MEKLSKKDLARISKLFGAMGGKARAKRLTPSRRSEIARTAVNARWAKRQQPAKVEDKGAGDAD